MLTYVAGADEAGRGCVIGPLVMCLFAIEPERQGELKKLGAKDSKLLSASQREQMAEQLPKLGPYELVEISAEELTHAMERKISLNELEARKLAEAITTLEGKGVCLTDVFVDSPDPIPATYARRIQKQYIGSASIHSANKAESKWPTVAAASILAKVRRDQRIEEIKKKVGYNFGSGYTSDPNTVQYLEKHHRDPKLQQYLRHRWETIKRLRGKQETLTHF